MFSLRPPDVVRQHTTICSVRARASVCVCVCVSEGNAFGYMEIKLNGVLLKVNAECITVCVCICVYVSVCTCACVSVCVCVCVCVCEHESEPVSVWPFNTHTRVSVCSVSGCDMNRCLSDHNNTDWRLNYLEVKLHWRCFDSTWNINRLDRWLKNNHHHFVNYFDYSD